MLAALLKSRGFWSCLSGTLAALSATFVGDGPANWGQVLVTWAAFLSVTLARKRAGLPTSYEGK